MDADPAMPPAPGTRLFFLGDEGVLFCAPRQELHRFNTTAALIWCHLEDGLDPPAIGAALAGEAGLEAGQARDFVAAALADWRQKHLLGAGLPVAAPQEADAALVVPAHPPPVFVSALRCALLDSVIRIRFTARAQRRLVAPILAHLATRRRPGCTLDVVGTAEGIVLYRDGIAVARCDGLQTLAPVAKHQVWGTALLGRNFLAQIHAGVVAGPAGCVLLPAAAGSGKSTLTAALVRAGFGYFSDEVALLEAESLKVRPFPLAICVKTPGLAVMARLFPQVAGLAVHLRGDGKHVAYMPPPAGAVPGPEARPVRALVFPRYQAGAALTRRALAPAEALQRMLDQCLQVGEQLTTERVGRLVAWIADLPAYELSYDDLDAAVAEVTPLLGEGARA